MADHTDAHAPRGKDYSTQRLAQRYRFDDPNMDLFFLAALGWAAAGGLSVGEAFYVASQIEDGNADSWAAAFERQGAALQAQADAWLARSPGLTRAAGEARLKAFACYRSAWQFVVPGERFAALFRTSQGLFDQALAELGLPAAAFSVPYGGGELPGHFFRAADPGAPTILVVGGADTCHEDRFLSQGRFYWGRGYAVALVDLPGQGLVQAQGLFWEPRAEAAVAAVLDALAARFGVDPRRTALLGMSLGGYFASRAAAEEPRLGAVIATPVLSRPGALFSATVADQLAEEEEAGAGAGGPGAAQQQQGASPPAENSPARNNMAVLGWKSGADSLEALAEKWDGVEADASKVQVPFLSVLGLQEGGLWRQQTLEWHAAIPSPKKRLVELDAATGADVHCQGNNTLRLVQEVDAFLREVLW